VLGNCFVLLCKSFACKFICYFFSPLSASFSSSPSSSFFCVCFFFVCFCFLFFCKTALNIINLCRCLQRHDPAGYGGHRTEGSDIPRHGLCRRQRHRRGRPRYIAHIADCLVCVCVCVRGWEALNPKCHLLAEPLCHVSCFYYNSTVLFQSSKVCEIIFSLNFVGSGSAVTVLAAGDRVHVQSSYYPAMLWASALSSFSGFLVHADD
jgi:hypothetical protein